jgi:hypothetical protein
MRLKGYATVPLDRDQIIGSWGYFLARTVTPARSVMKGVGELVEDQNGIEATVGFGKSTGR